jgi:hypothetical protein
MKPFEEKGGKVIGVIGWILVGLGGLFTTRLFTRGFSDGMKEPMILLFLITLIFLQHRCRNVFCCAEYHYKSNN